MNQEQFEQFNDEFVKEATALRRVMKFKHGKKVATVAGELVIEISMAIYVKATLHDVLPMQLTRCVAETLAGMVAGVDQCYAEAAKEKERN